MEKNEERVSKYSSGLNIIMRLDELWKNCAKFKRKGQFYNWNNELDTIWLELVRDLDESEYYDKKNDKGVVIEEGHETKFNKFDKELKKYLPFMDSFKGFGNPSNDEIKNRENQYEILMKKQIFLARMENKVGKGTSWTEKEDDWD